MNSRFIQHSAKYSNHPIQVTDPIQTTGIHLPSVTTLIKVNLNSLNVHRITEKF